VVVTQIFGIPVLTAWLSGLLDYLPNILAAVIIMFSGVVVGRLLGDLVASAVTKTGVSKGAHIRKLVQFIILFIASVIAINQIGIDIHFLTNLITIILAALLFGASLAFGLGARTSVSNILGSYYLQKTYQEGNTVKIGDIEGVIIKITPTAVYLKTKNGQVTVPAKDFNEEKTVLLNEV
jgi:small-conductance mechanosensitive channel